LELGVRSRQNLRSVERGLGSLEWIETVRLGAGYARVRRIDGRCNCDASSAECVWTQQGFGHGQARYETDDEDQPAV
jgi:hypothetical protein